LFSYIVFHVPVRITSTYLAGSHPTQNPTHCPEPISPPLIHSLKIMVRENKKRKYEGRGRHGARATKGGRKVLPYKGHIFRIRMSALVVTEGEVRREVWRRRVDGPRVPLGTWDSIVHRFGREIGFSYVNSPYFDDSGDARIQEVGAYVNTFAFKPKKYAARVRMQSNIECFVLSTHPDDPYAKHLEALREETQRYHQDPSYRTKRLTLQAPREQIILSYMKYLRDDQPEGGRYLKVGTIKLELDILSQVLKEFYHPAGLHRTSDVKKLLEAWEEEDDVSRAVAFDPETTLPEAWNVLWRETPNQSYRKKVRIWSRFLGQFALIGRASDVTSGYCPKIQDVSLPANRRDWLRDGTPRYLDLVWYNWKGRRSANVGSEYHIRIYHNPKHLKYDPITWIIKEWRSRTRAELKEPGAEVFFPLSARAWNEALRTYVFGPLDLACTSHSVRRSAAQWAGRCGSDISVIRNVGRWECLSELLKYVAEGNERSLIMTRDHDADPIFDFWPFFPNCAVSSMSSTRQQLAAMKGGRGNTIKFK
jgi:hypothetical protein